MRSLIALSLALLASACTLLPAEVPAGNAGHHEAVVFDIDGTLTPAPRAIHTARADAASAARHLAEQGYQIVYLSARVRLLQSGIPGWLHDNGFPDGIIHVPQSHADSGDHAAFKTRILQQYRDKGWRFAAAFGDSSTDFQAYAAAGIPVQRVFALRREGADACQPGAWQACLPSWAALPALPAAD